LTYCHLIVTRHASSTPVELLRQQQQQQQQPIHGRGAHHTV